VVEQVPDLERVGGHRIPQAELGEVPADEIRQVDSTLLDEHHDRGRGQRLGRRADLEAGALVDGTTMRGGDAVADDHASVAVEDAGADSGNTELLGSLDQLRLDELRLELLHPRRLVEEAAVRDEADSYSAGMTPPGPPSGDTSCWRPR
jgi:hypothetical protein